MKSLILFCFCTFALFSIGQTKEVDVSAQKEALISSLERVSANESKLKIIEERTANIPKEEIENSEIAVIIEKYTMEKKREERQVISIEHYLKSINTQVEIPFGRFDRLSNSIKLHLQSDSMYVIINPSN